MKSEVIKISEVDKDKISKTVRRDEQVNSGFDLRQKVYKNKKKYTRKSKHKTPLC